MGNRGSLIGIQQGFVVRKCIYCSGNGKTIIQSFMANEDFTESKTTILNGVGDNGFCQHKL